MSFSLVPYHPSYDAAIRQLEEIIVQGTHIKLKIIKNHFLDRSAAFQNYSPWLAIDQQGTLVGTSIAAHTKMIVEGATQEAGFIFDVKVHPSHQKHGVGRMMGKNHTNMFTTEGLEKNFITLKLTNAPVIKLASQVIRKHWLYDFMYLTIPTKCRVEKPFVKKGEQKFFVRLFDQDQLAADFYTSGFKGLGYFHTYNLYRLQIAGISWLYKQGLKILKMTNPGKYAFLPGEEEVMEFATLYNHSEHTIQNINQVLEHLDANGKQFLLVCCRKNDSIYHYLKKYSINSYSYYVMADFPLADKDELTIDARCL